MKLIKIIDLPELYNVPATNAYAPISHYRKKHNKEDPPWYHQRGGIGYVDVDYIEKVSTLSSRIEAYLSNPFGLYWALMAVMEQSTLAEKMSNLTGKSKNSWNQYFKDQLFYINSSSALISFKLGTRLPNSALFLKHGSKILYRLMKRYGKKEIERRYDEAYA